MYFTGYNILRAERNLREIQHFYGKTSILFVPQNHCSRQWE